MKDKEIAAAIRIRDKEIERLREENERLLEIVGIVENLHFGTDLFTICNDYRQFGVTEVSQLITLLEKLGKEDDESHN